MFPGRYGERMSRRVTNGGLFPTRRAPPPLAPPVQLGTYPTPVAHLERLSRPGSELWVKRDDVTSPLYGGNKVRKLEHDLAEAHARGATRILTVGAAGSHHVLATAIYGAREGFEVEAVLVPQRRTDHVAEHLRADLAANLRAVGVGSWAAVPAAVARRLGKGVYFVTVGGSSVAGAMGYVEAAREIAAQVRVGALPEPDLCVVTLGSGGTAAGLAAGFALEAMKTRVLAVTVATPPAAVAWMAKRLARACARYVGTSPTDAVARLDFDARYLGPGYGERTPWGDEATAVAAREGLTLDPTYTAKTFARVLDATRAEHAGRVLYVHTLSSAPMAPLLEGAPPESNLPRKLARLLK
jgi:1-aminocyclopropane-1-carboxylate deaminase/D-cysteine desulfhydrase-like pyridoxal-dependent ACC family enzyme